MKKIIITLPNEDKVEHEGDTLFKTEDSLCLLNKNTVVFEAKGISDFTIFEIIGEPDKTLEQKQQEQIDFLTLQILEIMGV